MQKQEAVLRLTNFADNIRNSEEASPSELKLIEAIDLLLAEVNNRRLYGVVGTPADVQELARKMVRAGAYHDAGDSLYHFHKLQEIDVTPVRDLALAIKNIPPSLPKSEFNAKKHEETCAKNRAKRRKKKRR
jgi:hypothetical protein